MPKPPPRRPVSSGGPVSGRFQFFELVENELGASLGDANAFLKDEGLITKPLPPEHELTDTDPITVALRGRFAASTWNTGPTPANSPAAASAATPDPAPAGQADTVGGLAKELGVTVSDIGAFLQRSHGYSKAPPWNKTLTSGEAADVRREFGGDTGTHAATPASPDGRPSLGDKLKGAVDGFRHPDRGAEASSADGDASDPGRTHANASAAARSASRKGRDPEKDELEKELLREKLRHQRLLNEQVASATAAGGSAGANTLPPPAPPGHPDPDPAPGDGEGDPKVLRRKIRDIVADLDDDPQWSTWSVDARRGMVYATLRRDPDVMARPKLWSDDVIRDMIAREVPDEATTVVTPTVAASQPDHLEPLRLKVRKLIADNPRLTRPYVPVKEQREDTRELLDHDPEVQANTWTDDEIKSVLADEIAEPKDDETFFEKLRRRFSRRHDESTEVVETEETEETTEVDSKDRGGINPLWYLLAAIVVVFGIWALIWSFFVYDESWLASIFATIFALLALGLVAVVLVARTSFAALWAALLLAIVSLLLSGFASAIGGYNEDIADSNRNAEMRSNGLVVDQAVVEYCQGNPVNYTVLDGSGDVDPRKLDACSSELVAVRNQSSDDSERADLLTKAQAVKKEYCRVANVDEASCSIPQA